MPVGRAKKMIFIIGLILLAVLLFIDLILPKISSRPTDAISYSGTLNAVLAINTKIFHGQGVSAAIVGQDGNWAGVRGFSEADHPVEPDMLFNIASIGKNFLATLILQLVEKRELSLSDPISKWGLGSSKIDGDITILQLLNHTSGVFDWVTHKYSPFSKPYLDIDHAKEWTQEEVIDQLCDESYFSPGEGWHYSTTNYNLLKIIAEKITLTSTSLEISDRLLQPLELGHTLAMDIGTSIPPGITVAHGWADVDGDGILDDISSDSQSWITSMSPHMMYASAPDLARWITALCNGQVLGSEIFNRMIDFHRPTPDEPPYTGYGLGLGEIAVKGFIQAYGHLGYHYGYISGMLYLPRLDTAVVVLTNENNLPYQYGVAFGLIGVLLLRQIRFYFYALYILILGAFYWRSCRRS